ncbi:ABC transporter ATP-binding protein [Staphylococcus simiae]|uniref:ATP-binding cassette domain-containing protein n=1 Tax=Staphylococcus simiae TaxID=308354 RepID=UPI001A9595A6|nr:ATP-binding cassette domain-containing protein [Staphylococcus simiae]MBO1198440.1 ABC transporter ATP-binding protein [Staphylococcus simiae]MBO1200634.1 ABC transporter ATP-binding protein [Staphylococcus simiae]MBO1202905.1 ABC transporter ATP-binding protein [Staphylococcus simiae]MBO1210431.1 ABC transporter ATP-binding protein [Staphylococcus simiae]MBO1228971.1 ABC transporter ATP-binding protein [Staphylococcus simiae]
MSNDSQQHQSINNAVEVEQLTIYNNNQALLKSLSMTVKFGEFHAIVGESGSGKSLLVRTILNMRHSQLEYQGHVSINLNETDAVFQDANSNMFSNVTIQKHFNAVYRTIQSSVSKVQQQQQIESLLLQLGFSNPKTVLNSYPFQLSGGMAQRVAFVLAMVRHPKILILDEPTSALDIKNSNVFMHYLMDIVKQQQMTVIFITHDFNLVRQYATEVSIMKSGEIIESGSVKDVLSAPKEDYTQQLIDIANRRAYYYADN